MRCKGARRGVRAEDGVAAAATWVVYTYRRIFGIYPYRLSPAFWHISHNISRYMVRFQPQNQANIAIYAYVDASLWYICVCRRAVAVLPACNRIVAVLQAGMRDFPQPMTASEVAVFRFLRNLVVFHPIGGAIRSSFGHCPAALASCAGGPTERPRLRSLAAVGQEW